MSSIIQKIEIESKPMYEYTKEELAVLDEFNKELLEREIIFSVGDMVIHDDGDIIRIEKFVNEPEERWYRDGKKIDEPYIEIEKKIVFRSYRGGKWDDKTTTARLSEFFSYRYKTKLFGSIEDLHKDVINIITGVTPLISVDDNVSDSTEIMTGVSKELLENHQRELRIKRDILDSKRSYMKGFLEKKTRQMYSMVESFKRQIKKVMRVIQTLELFLGIKEELMQIQEGEPADVNEPISFRQQILYMDEEVGDPEHGGLDFKNIEDFDNWLLKYSTYYQKNNYELLIPEKKGVVAIRVRREEKQYVDNPFLNSLINASNHSVYLLIRNGENIYRIWSENLSVSKRLFPGRDEFMKLTEEYSKTFSEYDKEKLDNKILDYKAHFVMLQGLIDRTEVFNPLPESINLLSPEPLEKGLVNFIYDDGICLPDNRVPYVLWRKKINSVLEEGCRIFFTGYRWDYSDRKYDIGRRLKRSYRSEHSAPNAPRSGVYTIIEDPEWRRYGESKDKKIFKFIYRPEAPYWSDEEVKKGVSFKIEDYDENYLNYDAATLDEIEFYLHNRLDRRAYLSMMPVLIKMKAYKLKEISQENEFVKLVVGELIRVVKGVSLEQIEKEVWELVTWWKLKNKWKRAIESDNSKALRMIVKEYTSKLKEV